MPHRMFSVGEWVAVGASAPLPFYLPLFKISSSSFTPTSEQKKSFPERKLLIREKESNKEQISCQT
jgi:hypothetical protein